MMTVLDIDLDFFTTPIVYEVSAKKRVTKKGAATEPIEDALIYLRDHCKLPITNKTLGASFEHHDEVFNYALRHFTEPVHLIHVDAHADIGGGFTTCWDYVTTEYAHLPLAQRRMPKRGKNRMNCGNFIVFLAACGLLERVTFVSHPDWSDDYNPIYMKDCDPGSNALQIKKVLKSVMEESGMMKPFCELPHEVEPAIPFTRISREDFYAESPPDMLLVTRSPEYTPESADALYDAIVQTISPIPAPSLTIGH